MGAIVGAILRVAVSSLRFAKGIGSILGRSGKLAGSLFGKGGTLAGIGAFFLKIWKWLVDKVWFVWVALSVKIAYFFALFRKITGTAVIVGVLTKIFQFLIKFILKKPVFIVVFLLLNEWFPTILETWFRLVGAVLLRIAIPLIQSMYNQMRTISESVVKDFSGEMESAFAAMPDCIGAHLAYLNVHGCVGMLASALGLCIAYRLVSMAYGFYTKR